MKLSAETVHKVHSWCQFYESVPVRLKCVSNVCKTFRRMAFLLLCIKSKNVRFLLIFAWNFAQQSSTKICPKTFCPKTFCPKTFCPKSRFISLTRDQLTSPQSTESKEPRYTVFVMAKLWSIGDLCLIWCVISADGDKRWQIIRMSSCANCFFFFFFLRTTALTERLGLPIRPLTIITVMAPKKRCWSLVVVLT
jgi:hypothetical protein